MLEPRPEPEYLVRIRALPPSCAGVSLWRRTNARACRRSPTEDAEAAYAAFKLPLDRLHEREAELAQAAGAEDEPEWVPPQWIVELQEREEEARERSLTAAEQEASVHSPP